MSRPAALRHLALAAITAACVFSTLLPAAAQSPDKPVAVRVAYIPVVTWLPSWVAKEKGFFAKHGLDVTLTVTQNLSLLPGTLGRQFDLAASTPTDLLKAVGSGLDVAAVAAEAYETTKNPTTHIIVAADSGLKSAKDLAGKLIATPTIGAVIHVATLYWLKKNGVDHNSIRAVEVPFPNMADQLKAKRVDAVESLEPFAGALLKAGNVSLGLPILAPGNDVLFTFWIAQGAWAKANLGVIKAWIAGLEEAKAFIEKEPVEARKIVAQYTKLPEAVVQAVPFPEYRFKMKAEDLALWANVLRDIGQLDKDVDKDKLVITPQ